MNSTITPLKCFIPILIAVLCSASTGLFAQYSSDDYFERGKRFHQEADFAKAIDYYTQAISMKTNCGKCLYNRGLALIELEKYHKALNDFDQVLIINPADMDAYAQRGGLHYLLGNTQQAVSDYNYVIKVNPSPHMYVNRAMAYLEVAKYYEALRDLEVAATMDPTDAEIYRVTGDVYFAKNDLEQAIEHYNKTLELNPKDEVALNNRGNIYHQSGEESLALADYNQALSYYPNSYTYTNRANYWLKKGDYEKALTDCREASRLDYNNAEAYNCIGQVENARGNHQSALENFNKAIAINSDQAPYYNGRGIALFALQQYDDALEDFEQAVSIDPSDAAAKDRIMDCHQKMSSNTLAVAEYDIDETEDELFEEEAEPEEREEVFTARGISTTGAVTFTRPKEKEVDEWSASRDIDQILAEQSQSVDMEFVEKGQKAASPSAKVVSKEQKAEKYIELGDFYYVSKDYEEALQHYESALWHDKYSKTGYLKKAQCLLAIQQDEAALVAFDQHIIMHPDEAEAYLERGQLRFRTGNIFGAKEDYDQGLSLNDQHTQLLLSRAQWNAYKGFYLKAIDDYSAIININPQANIYHQRGLLWFQLKNYTKAIDDCTQAILLSEVEKHDYYFARGLAYQFNKRVDLALYDFDKTIALSPRFAKAYMYRAAAKSSKGDQPGTCADYKIALALGYKVTDNIDFVSHCK